MSIGRITKRLRKKQNSESRRQFKPFVGMLRRALTPKKPNKGGK